MSLPRGRRVPLSPARRLVAELMRACRGIPTVTIERRLALGDLVAARRELPVRPMWTAIVAKAFALVAAEMPVLRRSYISFPWAHLYEHAGSVAGVVVERECAGERTVFVAQVRRPDTTPLAEIDAFLRECKDAPVESIRRFRRAMRLARLPMPLRRLGIWLGLHASGRLRERHAGTFGLTSPAAAGAGMVQLITALTATLHYGLFDPDGHLDMRMTFDHRVLDGAEAARALVALERVLRGPVRDELRAQSKNISTE